MCRLLLAFYLWCTCLPFATTLALDINATCAEECNTNLKRSTSPGDVKCNNTCRVTQCRFGCALWKEATSSNCDEACNQTFERQVTPTKHVHCNMGCRFAADLYIQSIKDELGADPPAPVLVAETQTNVSVGLRWKGPSVPFAMNVSYLVQWKYESLPGATWEYYRPKVAIKGTTSQIVEGLRPYTKYKFRVAWIVLSKHDLIFSEESVCISTLAYGPPSMAPVITSVSNVDATRVSVTWEPPWFPNGPILSYVVHLSQQSEGFTLIKDIPEPNADNFFIFNNLKSETTYSVAVSCRNSVGEGPRAIQNITTLAGPLVIESTRAFLVIAIQHKVVKLNVQNMMDELLFQPINSSVHITGMASHSRADQFFVSDSSGDIHRVPISGFASNAAVITPAELQHQVSHISVDWLNEKLYLVENRQISRCDLDGSNYQVVLTGLNRIPSDLQVDPFYGYLYWVVPGPPNGGLYRIDLEDLGTSVLIQDYSHLLVQDNHLSTLAIDHHNFCLLLANNTENTVYAVSLAGSELVDVRHNTQQPKFQGTKGMVIYQDLLYWATTDQVYEEEHLQDTYYHNSIYITKAENAIVALDIVHLEAQPVPVPVNPVRNLQALFHDVHAQVAWLPPKPLGGLGRGAWQQWRYEVTVKDALHNETVSKRNVTSTSYTVTDLERNTSYSVRVRAYSESGAGPWSQAFNGTTLKPTTKKGYPYILWSSKGLFKTDVIGDSVEPVISASNLVDLQVTDMAWHDDLLFLNTDSSKVLVYNTSDHLPPRPLPNVTSAVSIAVDWLGRKLYWSNAKQQMILRANLDGSQVEPLLILTIANELNIDSVNGRIYWTTSHSVECARLNGDEPRKYFQTGFFSGRKVMGLSLDHDHKRVVWMVWSFEGAKLYHSPMASYYPVAREELTASIATVHLGSCHEDAVQGSIRYFSDRLYWLRDHNEAIVSDISGQNAAHLYNSELADLRSLVIVDPSLQPYPSHVTADTVQVIPSAVDVTAVTVNGVWKDFNISWPKVSNMNHGQVFYEIGIDDGSSSIVTVSEYAFYAYPHLRPLPPYSKLTLSVRAFSYWGSSPRMVTTVHSPMSVPSEPLNPRVFVDSVDKGSVDVEFRWAPPKRPNGIILGYVATVWIGGAHGQRSPDPIGEEDIPGEDTLFHVAKHLNRNATYFFQVRAYTEVGEGPQSDSVEARTHRDSPIPKLLLVKEHMINVADMDSHKEVVVSSGVLSPSGVGVLWADETLFWLDKNSNALFRSNTNGTDKAKLHSLTSNGNSLSVDWVGRRLYWSEVDDDGKNSSIWALDIDRKVSPKVLVTTDNQIGSIKIDPFTNVLLWTSIEQNGLGSVVKCKPDGSERHSLFPISKGNRDRIQRDSHSPLQSCNCPHNVAVAPAITLDSTVVDRHAKRLFFVDSRHKQLWASELEGCNCHLLLNGSDHGFPPTSLTVDSNRIYWSNTKTSQIFSIEKPETAKESSVPVEHVMDGVKSIEAIGSHLQPYPDFECLIAPPYDKPPVIVNATDVSVSVHLEAATHRSHKCRGVSIAPVLYTIYYTPLHDAELQESSVTGMAGPARELCHQNATSCLALDTYELTNTVTGLQPFTVYSFRVAVSNFYNVERSQPGPAARQRTSEVPPKPKNVVVTVLSPQSVDVSWEPAAGVRGPHVTYTVYWRRQLSSSNTVSVTSSNDNFETASNASKPLHHLVTSLDPGQEYAFWVRAQAGNGSGFNESNEVTVKMYDVPNDLRYDNATSTSLALSWTSSNTSVIVRHSLKYKKVSDTLQHTASDFEATEPGHSYQFVVHNLVAKSRYIFWLLLDYNSTSDGFVYQWPKGDKFTYETLGDFPGPPGAPEVLGIQRDVYKVLWRPADSRGGVQLGYVLEVKPVDENADSTSEFAVVYNGSDTKWTMAGLSPDARYVFRVCAYNEYGVGNLSEHSPSISFSDSSDGYGSTDEQLAIVLGSTVPVLFLLLSSIAYVLFKVHQRREKEKKILQEMALNAHNPDLELATLRDLPQNHNFIHQNNALYALSDIPSDAELAALPHVSSNQIVLIKFLGCGAFGEVFEGIARTLPGEIETDIRVAVKTLRKGATDHEKAEFLKEAQLMSNFKHNHILSLLGVCLDNDPNFLILELMDGGDLLTYLRNSRPTAFSPSPMSSHDLISICVDVARGCCHLEDMHFIHRDLAARNCLVSSHDCSQRTVKIGDFGLARDIYKNDYYRKEGEGLLPVRWMSPESLVDGVFTSQSDVWAFGVLLWEVMTLGQQPYPARTNVEVLHYVRGGGRLDKPDNCPDDLHQLMLKCWSYNPSERPTFRYCLEKLQELMRKSSQTPTPANNNNSVHNQNYLGRQESAGGVDNPAYNSDENVRSLPGNVSSRVGSSLPRTRVSEAETVSIGSATSDTGGGCRRLASETDNDDTTELLEKRQQRGSGSHRYLELLYDNDLLPEYDSDVGYEVPLSSSTRRKHPLVPVEDATFSPHSIFDCGDVRSRTMSDSSARSSSNGSIPPFFTGGVPCVSNANDCGSTTRPKVCGAEQTDDAKQLAVTYGRAAHRSRQRGASQPLLLTRLGEASDVARSRLQSRGSVASVGAIETSPTRKGAFRDGQLVGGSSAPLLDTATEHRRHQSHHQKHKPWRESSVSLGTDTSVSSDGIGASDPSTDATSSHLSGMSALSGLSSSTSGIDMDYAPSSTWC